MRCSTKKLKEESYYGRLADINVTACKHTNRA